MERSESFALRPCHHGSGIKAHELSELDPGQSLFPQIVDVAGAALKERADFLHGPELRVFCGGFCLQLCAHQCRPDVNVCSGLPTASLLCFWVCMTAYDGWVASVCQSLQSGRSAHWQIQANSCKYLQVNEIQRPSHNLKVVGSNPTPATTLQSTTYEDFDRPFLRRFFRVVTKW
jgi:hypothetical protein